MPDPSETVFHHPVTVRWADCDPARIAYTGKIPGFALEAIDAWWETYIGADWYEMNIDRNLGTPFVHLSLDFKSPVTPRHVLICVVRLVKVGESSVSFEVQGWQDNTLCFEGRFVEVTVEAEAHKKISIPDDIKGKLEAHLAS